MLPAAWLAKLGTDTAAAAVGQAGAALAGAADVVAAMSAATSQARRLIYLFDHPVALHAIGEHPPDRAALGRAVRRMEAETIRAARWLRRPR